MSEATLRCTNLRFAQIWNAKLTEAHLEEVDLCGASLVYVSLNAAALGNT